MCQRSIFDNLGRKQRWVTVFHLQKPLAHCFQEAVETLLCYLYASLPTFQKSFYLILKCVRITVGNVITLLFSSYIFIHLIFSSSFVLLVQLLTSNSILLSFIDILNSLIIVNLYCMYNLNIHNIQLNIVIKLIRFIMAILSNINKEITVLKKNKSTYSI